MRDFRTKVLQVTYSADPHPDRPQLGGRIRLAVVVLYPVDVKRQLATVEAAKARALELARETIQRQLYMPPDLDALACTVEVVTFDLRPFWEVARKFADGTRVWITEAERTWPERW